VTSAAHAALEDPSAARVIVDDQHAGQGTPRCGLDQARSVRAERAAGRTPNALGKRTALERPAR
jgi:hypothetical protein